MLEAVSSSNFQPLQTALAILWNQSNSQNLPSKRVVGLNEITLDWNFNSMMVVSCDLMVPSGFILRRMRKRNDQQISVCMEAFVSSTSVCFRLIHSDKSDLPNYFSWLLSLNNIGVLSNMIFCSIAWRKKLHSLGDVSFFLTIYKSQRLRSELALKNRKKWSFTFYNFSFQLYN